MKSLTWKPELVRLPESGSWIAITLSTEGSIISTSYSAEPLIGYSSRELVGRPVTHIMADRSAFETAHILETAKEWGIWSGEIALQNRSGKQLVARSNLTLLSGRNNEIIGFLLVSMLTNRSDSHSSGNAEKALEVGRKLRSFAHEMNNPLAVIMGITQLILLNAQCQGRIRTDLDKLYNEMKRIVQTVEKLHSYAISLQDNRCEESTNDQIAEAKQG